MQFNKITDKIIKELIDIVGKNNLIINKEEMEDYICDEMSIPQKFYPEVIVKPINALEISEILKLANMNNIPITPRGSGTGLSGGAVAIFGGILLSLERMDKIIEIDEDNFVAVVEPGVRLAELFKAVADKGLYYPLYPGEESASIGGNIATNAGGMRAVKYGVTRNFVLGLEAVLPTGEILETGGKFVKCTTGYNLTQLLIGSEGTLAVVTKIILKLHTAPKTKGLLFVPFQSLEDATKTVPRILKNNIIPVGIEFMEKEAIQISQDFAGKKLPIKDGEAFLLIIIEGDSTEEVFDICDNIGEICLENNAIDVLIPLTEKEKRDILEVREKHYYAIRDNGPVDLADVVVPRSRISEFMLQVKEISKKHNIKILGCGHAGDGNVHLSLHGDVSKFKKVFVDIYQTGKSFDGMVSGEHGIGFVKKDYFQMTMNQDHINLMRRIKKAFDPDNILNPGKIF
ncbi:MAG: FAD-binding oxidoreductase [Armatimonadetes bacterium]|nr:FAD-binding oxidoreductase [Armatimonadota bacterium]